MAEAATSGAVLEALLNGLAAQGQALQSTADRSHLASYPINGNIDLLALAEAVQSALGGGTSDDEDAKTPAELNAANDG